LALEQAAAQACDVAVELKLEQLGLQVRRIEPGARQQGV
jgi:hypothetical protein